MFDESFKAALATKLGEEIGKGVSKAMKEELAKAPLNTSAGDPLLLNATATARLLGISISLFNKRVRYLPNFPKPIKLYRDGHDLWHIEDIDAYIKALKIND